MNYGLLSLLPPIVAVILAIWSKNVILSLFCGGFVSAMIFCGGNPFAAVHSMIGNYFFVQLTDSYNAGVLVLIVFIGGFIKLVEKSGGAQAFGKSVYRIVNTKLKAQLCAWLGGILIFFSDLGTPLLGGHGEYPPDGQSLHRQQCAGGSSARSSADRAAGLWRDAVSGRAVLRTQQGAERHRVPQRQRGGGVHPSLCAVSGPYLGYGGQYLRWYPCPGLLL